MNERHIKLYRLTLCIIIAGSLGCDPGQLRSSPGRITPVSSVVPESMPAREMDDIDETMPPPDEEPDIVMHSEPEPPEVMRIEPGTTDTAMEPDPEPGPDPDPDPEPDSDSDPKQSRMQRRTLGFYARSETTQ